MRRSHVKAKISVASNEVQNYGAAPLLVVRDGARELLIPLVFSICVEIRHERKRIVIDPPEGLLELYAF